MLFLRAWLISVGLVAVCVSSWATDNLLVGPAPPPRPATGLNRLSLSPGTETSLFRQPPTLSGKVGSRPPLFLPYLGVGFSRGTTTDLSGTMMRESAQQGSLQDERLLRDMVGKSVTPNEVQLGIRLPF